MDYIMQIFQRPQPHHAQPKTTGTSPDHPATASIIGFMAVPVLVQSSSGATTDATTLRRYDGTAGCNMARSVLAVLLDFN